MSKAAVAIRQSRVPAALQMSESNEWYTPGEYIEAARKLMGGIDLDPASCEHRVRGVDGRVQHRQDDTLPRGDPGVLPPGEAGHTRRVLPARGAAE